MIRYILLTLNIIIFTPIFSVLVIFVGLFDSQKKYTSYLSRLWAKIILLLSIVNYNVEGLDKNNKSTDVSILGSIAAGTPIEAIQQEVDRVALPEDLQNNGEHYGLKVKGDSMVEAGINDGDTVIVKKTSNVDSGQIAVVLIDDQEATLKRIRKKGNTIALEAANRNYGTKIYAANRIKIQGKLVSLYRNFH